MHVFPMRTLPWRAFFAGFGLLTLAPIGVIAAALYAGPALAGWLFVLIVATAAGLMLAVQIGLMAMVLFVATRNEITLRGGTLHLKGGEFHERVPLETVVGAERVAAHSAAGLTGLKWRNGITLPGFRVGWYQRRRGPSAGRFVFVLATRASPLLHVTTNNRFDVLLGVDEPEALAERLLRNAPDDRD